MWRVFPGGGSFLFGTVPTFLVQALWVNGEKQWHMAFFIRLVVLCCFVLALVGIIAVGVGFVWIWAGWVRRVRSELDGSVCLRWEEISMYWVWH